MRFLVWKPYKYSTCIHFPHFLQLLSWDLGSTLNICSYNLFSPLSSTPLIYLLKNLPLQDSWSLFSVSCPKFAFSLYQPLGCDANIGISPMAKTQLPWGLLPRQTGQELKDQQGARRVWTGELRCSWPTGILLCIGVCSSERLWLLVRKQGNFITYLC